MSLSSTLMLLLHLSFFHFPSSLGGIVDLLTHSFFHFQECEYNLDMCRSRRLPSAKAPFFFKIFLLALVGFVSMLSGCKGVEYSNPTLASAISTLTPAFTFTLAVIFRFHLLLFRFSLGKVISAAKLTFCFLW